MPAVSSSRVGCFEADAEHLAVAHELRHDPFLAADWRSPRVHHAQVRRASLERVDSLEIAPDRAGAIVLAVGLADNGRLAYTVSSGRGTVTRRKQTKTEVTKGAGIAATFNEIRPALLRLVARIVGPDSIEDVVQETFIRSYEASRQQTIRHPRSFMYRTAKNIAINHVSKADNKLTTNIADFSEPDVYTETAMIESELEFESRERFLVFCQVVEKLPLQCRRVFILKRVYGLSQKEIAERLGISESTVEKQVAKGLLSCAAFMDEMGYPVGRGGRGTVPGRRATRGK